MFIAVGLSCLSIVRTYDWQFKHDQRMINDTLLKRPSCYGDTCLRTVSFLVTDVNSSKTDHEFDWERFNCFTMNN